MGGIRLALMGIAGSAVITAVGFGYFHYTGLVKEAAQLRANNAVLESAISLQDSTISSQQQAISEWEDSQTQLLKTMEQLATNNLMATEELRRLSNVFSEHDLNELSRRKPGLIETRIDRGTDRINCLLEAATSGNRNPDCGD